MNRLNRYLGVFLLLLLFGCTISVSAQTERSAWYREYNTSAPRNRTGLGKKVTYNVAIRISGDNEALVGKKIKAINFFLRKKETLAEDVQVWVAKRLPNTLADVDTKEELKVANLNGGDTDQFGSSNMIDFSTPYTLTSEGAYVGYTFTVKDVKTESGQYPLVISDRVEKNGLWLLRTSEMSQWEEAYRYYCPAIEVRLEGDFPENAAKPADFGKVAAIVGSKATVDIELLNFGSNVIENVDYTVTTTEGTKNYHVDLLPLTYKSLGTTILAPLPFDANATKGVDPVSLTITKVNGQPNGIAKGECKGELHTFAKETSFERGVLVEEHTSTSCINCPLGHYAMDAMREKGAGHFVGLSLHKNNSDPMAFARDRYADVVFTGTPQFLVNRGEILHVDNVVETFEKELTKPAFAKIDLKAKLSTDKTKVEVEAGVTSLLGGTYSIAYVLGGDNLYKTNGYGQYGKGRMTYNDVVLSTSYSSKKTTAPDLQLTANVKSDATFSLILSTTPALQEPLKEADLFVVAILTDKNGRVVNTARVPVEGATQPLKKSQVTIDAEVKNGSIATAPSGEVLEGTKVKLTNTPNANYRLVAFSVYKTGDKPFLMDVRGVKEGMPYFIMPHFPVTVSAEFELKTGKKYQVAVTSVANGTIQVDKAQAEEGEVVKVTTQANSGYRIKEGSLAYYKTENASEVTPIVSGQFAMPAYAVTVTAEFEDDSTPPAAKYAITVATVSNGTLSVNKSQAAEGDAVQITAAPSAGYRLKSGTLSVYKTEEKSVLVPVNEMQFTMPAYAVTVTAEFEKVDTPPAAKYAITVATMPNGTLSVNKSQAAEGDAVQITATPSTGYRLKSGTLSVYKTEDNSVVVPVNETQFTMPAYAVTVTAEFEKVDTPPAAKYAITVATVPNGTLSVNKSQAAEGDVLQITATPSAGYRLKSGTLSVYKTEDKSVLVPVNEMQFTMPAYAVTVTAEFEKVSTPSPTAVEDAAFANVVIFPNPFSEQLQINLDDAQGATYELLNVCGVVLQAGTLVNGENTVTTANLPAGLYFVKVVNGERQTIKTSRVIKK